ncbi:ankyrin repeat domain-containing protein [Pseudoflavonifractor sp. An44]|uniref:ankyrin repeat domain-containing protein n=1 Tax=Pseudoflavonifractor sp. An44 TaxID=1965635 RepID=UPI001302210C|nr:ankyrin repeat domain-containing protein [Pseudoflavonifractor sp. An44]
MRKATDANMPPLVEAIKSGDLEKLRFLLDNGHSPNEVQRYTTSDLFHEVQSAIREMFGNGILAKGAMEQFRMVNGGEQEHVQKTPLELAVQENRENMVRLLVERGADLTQNGDELIFAAIKCQNYSTLSYLVEAGVRLEENQRSIYHLFSFLEGQKNPELLTIVDRLQIDFKRYGGEPLRTAVWGGDRMLAEYLIQNGADIDYHKPDEMFPYASTPVIEAARQNDFHMVRWLVGQGADITIPDKYGDRPYTLAVQNKNQEMAAYLRNLEPEDWHNEENRAQQLAAYKMPTEMVEYLKTGPLRLEFPEQDEVQWAELYSYMDVLEVTWKREKLLSVMAQMDNYPDYLLLWNPKDKRLWYLDVEHEEFHALATWEDFIADPGKYLNGMIIGWECGS